MNNFFELKKIFIFSGILSIILTPVVLPVNQEIYARSNCTNWAGLPDNDCDALANAWEDATQYTKLVSGSTITVNLPSGVNKDHRDILVEIDYMSHHVPPSGVIDSVVSRFNAMEIMNPDGRTGINLHYIINDDVPHRACINVFSDTDTNSTNDFDNIKKNFMGTAAERVNPEFYQAKRDVFHYALFIHTRCGSLDIKQSSGRSEQPGNDFVVSLGYPGWGNVINGHDTGSNEYKAAVFMHELGHNLYLKHGGSSERPYCKPNYISVMNNLYQFGYQPIDYSHSVMPVLNESALVELNGIGPSINNIHTNACNDNDVTNSTYGSKLFGFDDVHEYALTFWGFSGIWSNGTGVPITSDIGSPMLPDDLVASTKNNSIASKSTKSAIQTNETTNDISRDPTLPPCDISTVPGCQDSPCDKADPLCKIDIGHDFTNKTLLTTDYGGSRTQDHRDLTVSDVLQAISSKALNINAYLQSINPSRFTTGTNTSTLNQDLQNSLVNATGSVYSLIKSSKSDEALAKILKLRSLLDGLHSSIQILQDPYNVQVLNLVDNLIFALEKRS